MPGRFIEVAGLQTYVEEYGHGEPLVLLHGGLETVDSLIHFADTLAEDYHVIMPERRGHGRTPDVPGSLSYDAMAADTLALLDALEVTRADCVGYSDGASVALLLALAHPERVGRLVLVSGNFHHGGLTRAFRDELHRARADTYEPLAREAYQRLSPDGPEHWPVVFGKVRHMWRSQPGLTRQDLRRIDSPTLVLAGDRDVVSVAHTVAMSQAIPRARLAIVPGGTHGLLFEEPMLVEQLISEFLRDSRESSGVEA